MKKIAKHAAYAAIITISLFALNGCNSATEPKSDSQESIEMAQATYACPMDCEKGKTYDEPGDCPVCGMDLTEVKETE